MQTHHQAAAMARGDLHEAANSLEDIWAYLHRLAVAERGAAHTPAWEAARRLAAI
jgi:hypothetical protein